MAFTPKFEQMVNNASSTLNGGINDVVTSLDVNDASSFPSDGNFRIRINNEIMLVTAVSTDTFTVVRGAESSVAASHSNGDAVIGIVTAGSLKRMAMDYTPFWGAKPVMHSLTDISGNALDSTDFTWVNQGTSSVEDMAQGGLMFTIAEHTGVDLKGFVRSVPQEDFQITVCLSHSCIGVYDPAADKPWIGIGLRESSTGFIEVFYFRPPYHIAYEGYSAVDDSTPTVFDSDDGYPASTAQMWLQFERDLNNLDVRFSNNGCVFHKPESNFNHSETTFFSVEADQVGIFMSGTYASSGNGRGNGTDFKAALLHWSEEDAP